MAVSHPMPRFAPPATPVPALPRLPVVRPAAAPVPATSPSRARGERVHVTPSRAGLIEEGGRLAVVLIAACVAIFLDASTSYESSTALPYIQGAVGATPDQGSWIVTLFNAAYDTSILGSPWFLVRLGRRRAFAGALSVFAVTSLGCALTTDYTAFLVLRTLEGFALGGFFACGVIALFMTVPDRLRLYAVMTFSMTSQLGSALGPAVAGHLVYVDAWQFVFVMNAVIAALAAIAVAFVLRDPEPARSVPFDAIGAGLIAVTFLCLQYLVNEGERRNWTEDPWVTLALVVTPLSGAAMLAWKLRFSPHPFLDFRVLRHRNLVVGAVFGVGFGIMLQAATQIGGFVESALDFTPALGGGLDAIRAYAIVVFVPLVTYAIAEHVLDVRAALLLGLAIAFAGFRGEVLMTTSTADFTSFVIPFATIGIGIAILYRALASVIFGTLPPAELVMGLLVYKMSGTLGGALAAPVFATFLDHATAAHQNDLAGSITLGSAALRDFAAANHGAIGAIAGMVHSEAATMAYSDLWSWASVLVAALAAVILFLDVAPKSEADR